MIDRGDIRQAIDRCRNIWAFLPGAGYGQFEHSDSLITKIQRSGRNSQRLMYRQSHPRLSPLWLSASSSACHGLLLIITVITPLPTKLTRQMPENWSWRTRQLLTCRCVSVMLLRSMQNTRRVIDAKAENDALRDDVAAGRRRLHIKAVTCRSVREATTSGVDIMQPPPTGRHRWTGSTPSERGWSLLQKQLKEPRSILMSSADRVAA